MRWLVLLGTHGIVLLVGFALGIYVLPILTEPPAPNRDMLSQKADIALYQTEFLRDLKGNDFLHWGEGQLSVSAREIIHVGELAPGPDYKLYLTKSFVEDEAEFLKIKEEARRIGDVKTFKGFLVNVPEEVDVNAYTTVVIWCEAFGEFITAAKYR
ncbi:MAG: DM13 domain-containing protein [Sneathiellales bacterium]|nr:DM13 domain-containing protein [Sneathiellales bacterium]